MLLVGMRYAGRRDSRLVRARTEAALVPDCGRDYLHSLTESGSNS